MAFVIFKMTSVTGQTHCFIDLFLAVYSPKYCNENFCKNFHVCTVRNYCGRPVPVLKAAFGLDTEMLAIQESACHPIAYRGHPALPDSARVSKWPHE